MATRSEIKAAAILTIAKEHLGLHTLETRNSDALDFTNVSVWTLRRALEAAYDAGRRASRAHAKPGTLPLRKVGDKVFDMPSQEVHTITEFAIEGVDVYYRVDAPANATQDGAFPDGWRNDFEVTDADKTLPRVY